MFIYIYMLSCTRGEGLPARVILSEIGWNRVGLS